MAEEFKNTFEPAHYLSKQAVVMDVNFMYEFVKIILMASAKVNEGLDRLVWIGRDVLSLSREEDGEHVVGKGGEVADGAVDVGRFVDADEGFVEDGKEVAKEAEGDGFFDHREHLGFVTLSSVHF